MRRTLTALTLTAAVACLLTPTPTTYAGADDEFHFRGTIDTDGDGQPDADLGLNYDRHLLGDTAGLDAEAGWVDGDRRGYRCGFGFLEYRDHIVARVTVSGFRDPVDPKNNGYVKINDRFMAEQVRNFDGTRNRAGTQTKECTTAVEAYEPLEGAAEPPQVTFQHGPHPIDVRDFTNPLDVDSTGGVVFDLASATPTQVIVIAYAENGTLPILTVYYDLIGDVTKGVPQGAVIPGTMHPVTMHVGCGLECADHEMHEGH